MSCLWSLEKPFWNIQSTLITSLTQMYWTGENGWSGSIFLWVTLLSWVRQPSRGMFKNMGKYNPLRQKSGFNCQWRLLKWQVRCDKTHIRTICKWVQEGGCEKSGKIVLFATYLKDELGITSIPLILFLVTGLTTFLLMLLGSTFFMISYSIPVLCCSYLCASGTVNVL